MTLRAATLCCMALSTVWLCAAQQPPSIAEDQALNTALADAGASPADFTRALENHLARYPQTQKRTELERALVRSAIEAKDDRRILLYGEHVLDREAGDPQILDKVIRLLLASDSRESAERALPYARRYKEQLTGLQNSTAPPPGRLGKAQWREEVDRGVARALVLEARATANLGKMEDALTLAQRAYAEFPTAEGAREIARCLNKLDRAEEALPHMADAFTIVDPRNNDNDRARDRGRIGDVYRKIHGSEKGLGDLLLESYDRTTSLVATRRMQVQQNDPNAQAATILEYTLSGLRGEKLPLANYKGKTVILEFWATWCGPCRAQHPLLEQVKQHFRSRGEVVFVSVNTDEERDQVEPFLKEQDWKQPVYFEDGLARMLRITSIPTTIILDRRGEVASRMNGFSAERFVGQLIERIEETLKN
jgi:thiol-disulfide isomerase/thioredoxin